MNGENRLETQQVVSRIMKTVEQYDQIGKAEFEAILQQVMEEVDSNTGAAPERIVGITDKVIQDLPQEYGQLREEQRSWEALVGYLYRKYLRELGVL
jgi:hypothetical protein